MLSKPARESLVYGGGVAAVLLLGWFLYEPALSSVFLLDDRPSLFRLTSILDMESALLFTFSGTAGPIGRPLSLATFVPQAGMWDLSAAPFLIVNVLIHLLNGLLVYYFFRQLARERRLARRDIQLVAIAAMALWLFMPLLASSSLMVIQRMTTLSAMFVLITLNIYISARTLIQSRPRTALLGMSASLVLGTLIAVLAKENGALLPSLLLVLEATLLTRPQSLTPMKWRTWQTLFLGAPTLLIVGFLLSNVPYSNQVTIRKDFTGVERLLTEARVLWEYVCNAFIAQPSQYGPFHDGYPVADSLTDPITLFAVFGWLLLIGLAVAWRRKYSVAAFAVLWFITGHLLESTTIPLYLYFEHRNYVPLLGPVFAISYLLLVATGEYRKVARAALSLYILVNAGILYSVTSLWGSPLTAAAYWHVHSPNSVAAVGHLATQQMRDMSSRAGVITLQEYAVRYPQHAYLRLPELAIACMETPNRDHSSIVEFLKANLPSVEFTYTVAEMLDNLMSVIANIDCNGVDRAVGRDLAAAVVSNPRFKYNNKYHSAHHQLMARAALEEGDNDEAIRQLEKAKALMSSDRLDMMYVSTFVADQRFDDARNYIERATDSLPMHPLRRYASKINLRQLRRYVDELERIEHDRTDYHDGIVQATAK